MLVEFSIIPLGEGSSLGEHLAEVLRIVDESGLPYKLNPMGTCIEGEWNEVFRVIRKCHSAMMKRADRVVLQISVDDRKGRTDRLEGKIRSIEKRLGRKLRK